MGGLGGQRGERKGGEEFERSFGTDKDRILSGTVTNEGGYLGRERNGGVWA